MMKHLIKYTQETFAFEPFRETQEDKFLLVDFQTRENYNNHKKQSFCDCYYMIEELYRDSCKSSCKSSDEKSSIMYGMSFSNEQIPDNCPEMIVPLIEEPSRVMMCCFLDKNKKRVKIGIEFYSDYNVDWYNRCLDEYGCECLSRYASRYFKDGPYLFLDMGCDEEEDAVINVQIWNFAIKNPPE